LPDKETWAVTSRVAVVTFAFVGIPFLSDGTYLEFVADALTVFGIQEVIWVTNFDLKAFA
jgi:hypothetical protein